MNRHIPIKTQTPRAFELRGYHVIINKVTDGEG